MAPVILAMDVHCDSCAKKIRKAVMKVPGVESVSASFETGLVVVEGTADAAALRARLQAKTKKNVNVVSDGTPAGEYSGRTYGATGGSSSSSSPPSSPAAGPAPAPPIVLDMELHCRSCAEKVERRVMEIPGVDRVKTDVPRRRVEVTGTADASAVATSLEVRTRKPVRVVSDPRSGGAPGYDHEWRKAAAARAAAEQMQEMYGGTTHVAATSQRAPTPPFESAGGSSLPSSSTASWYGASPPQADYYSNYPAQGGVYGGQAGQQWPAYPQPEPEPEGYNPYAYPPPGMQTEGYYPYGGQQENSGSCSIQ